MAHFIVFLVCAFASTMVKCSSSSARLIYEHYNDTASTNETARISAIYDIQPLRMSIGVENKIRVVYDIVGDSFSSEMPNVYITFGGVYRPCTRIEHLNKAEDKRKVVECIFTPKKGPTIGSVMLTEARSVERGPKSIQVITTNFAFKKPLSFVQVEVEEMSQERIGDDLLVRLKGKNMDIIENLTYVKNKCKVLYSNGTLIECTFVQAARSNGVDMTKLEYSTYGHASQRLFHSLMSEELQEKVTNLLPIVSHVSISKDFLNVLEATGPVKVQFYDTGIVWNKQEKLFSDCTMKNDDCVECVILSAPVYEMDERMKIAVDCRADATLQVDRYESSGCVYDHCAETFVLLNSVELTTEETYNFGSLINMTQKAIEEFSPTSTENSTIMSSKYDHSLGGSVTPTKDSDLDSVREGVVTGPSTVRCPSSTTIEKTTSNTLSTLLEESEVVNNNWTISRAAKFLGVTSGVSIMALFLLKLIKRKYKVNRTPNERRSTPNIEMFTNGPREVLDSLSNFEHQSENLPGQSSPLFKVNHFSYSSSHGSLCTGEESNFSDLKNSWISSYWRTKFEGSDVVVIEPSSLTVEKLIGKGHFGEVSLGTMDMKSGLVRVAVKTFLSAVDSEEEMLALAEEASTMVKFNHQNVLNVIGICIRAGSPSIVMPYQENGDLLSYVQMFSNKIDLNIGVRFGREIAAGMEYLTSKKLVHRDLAARNCLLDEKLIVKVADFGLSRSLYDQVDYRTKNLNLQLPLRWMAPEAFTLFMFNEKTDVWSFGVTLWEIMTGGQRPYGQLPNSTVMCMLRAAERLPRENICHEIYGLMTMCWSADPANRPTFLNIANFLATVFCDNPRKDNCSGYV